MRYNYILLLLLFGFSHSVAAATDSPVNTVTDFYKVYLESGYKQMPASARPAMPLSSGFGTVVRNTAHACQQYADYPCGWGADGDEYLDAQEYDPALSYQNSGITIAEIKPGVVQVVLNVYPSITNAGNYYVRKITYNMLKESGKWVVDDVMYADGKSEKAVLIEEAKEAELEYKKHQGDK